MTENGPLGVRAFVYAAKRVPRPAMRLAMGCVGWRTAGHVDDVGRVARPWGFEVEGVAARVPVAAWHASDDAEVPVAPWRSLTDVVLSEHPGEAHVPPDQIWHDVIAWVAAFDDGPTLR